MQPIPVVCDRCRAEGAAGGDPFAAFGALLDFDPVPRRTARADGWDEEVQKAFIAALSLTGSPRQAARAVGKAAFGAGRLREAEGGEGFRAAWDEAIGIAADERGRRLAEGLAAVADEAVEGRRLADPPWAKARSRVVSPAEQPPASADALEAARDADRLAVLDSILKRYLLKLDAERRVRMEGRIAEADFYLRQITMLEVALDVTSGDGMAVLKRARRGEYDLLEIAETEMSKLLDEARRAYWLACGDPPRPEYPPRHLLVEHEGYAVEVTARPPFGTSPADAERRRAIEDQRASDAAAQVEWEAQARRDYERRRDSAAGS